MTQGLRYLAGQLVVEEAIPYIYELDERREMFACLRVGEGDVIAEYFDHFLIPRQDDGTEFLFFVANHRQVFLAKRPIS